MARIILLVTLLFAATAHARPQEDPNLSLAPWFNGLREPGTGKSSCVLADCSTADYRIKRDHYEARVGDKWLVVPSDEILHRTDNPTSRSVVCWTPELGILCLVRPAET